MNGQGICRQELDGGRKCGRSFGHDGGHMCCALHKPRPGFEPPAGWRSS